MANFGLYRVSSGAYDSFYGSRQINGVVAPPAPVAGNAVAFSQNVGYNVLTWTNVSFSGGPTLPIFAVVTVPPLHGTAAASGSGVSYTPDSGYVGGDSFTYVGSNVTGAGTSAVGSLTVAAAPVAGDLERLFPTVQNVRLFPSNRLRSFPKT